MRRRVAFVAAVAAIFAVSAGARADQPKYDEVPEAFRKELRAGVAREQFVAGQMSPFRGVARGRTELDRAAVDTASALNDAAQRAAMLAGLLRNDLDGDGRVTREEAEQVASAQSVGRAGRGVDQRVHRIMALDANNDGVVDEAELRAGATSQFERSAGRQASRMDQLLTLLKGERKTLRAADLMRAAERAFDLVDLDGDTLLSEPEAQAFAEAVGLPTPRRRVEDPLVPTPPAPVRGETEEAFLVGVYQGFTKTAGAVHGPRALVAVDRIGKQVTLLLCSYEPVRWSVTLTPGTTLKEVRLFGYSRTSEVLVDDKPVTPIAMGRSVECAHERKGREFARFSRSLKQLTGFDRLTDFAGAYSAAPEGFILDRVYQEPEKKVSSLRPVDPATLPAMRFPAALTQGPGYYDLAGRLLERGAPANAYRTLDVPSRNERYVIGDEGLTRTAITGSGTPKTFALSLDVPPLSWPTGIAYDSKRNRILVVSLGGEGFLYAFDIASETWRVVASMDNNDVNGLFYDAAADRLWALGAGLVSIGMDGAIDRRKSIYLSGAPGLADFQQSSENGTELRLAALQDGKAVMVASNRAGESVAFRIYLVDLATGKAELTGADG